MVFARSKEFRSNNDKPVMQSILLSKNAQNFKSCTLVAPFERLQTRSQQNFNYRTNNVRDSGLISARLPPNCAGPFSDKIKTVKQRVRIT